MFVYVCIYLTYMIYVSTYSSNNIYVYTYIYICMYVYVCEEMPSTNHFTNSIQESGHPNGTTSACIILSFPQKTLVNETKTGLSLELKTNRSPLPRLHVDWIRLNHGCNSQPHPTSLLSFIEEAFAYVTYQTIDYRSSRLLSGGSSMILIFSIIFLWLQEDRKCWYIIFSSVMVLM